MIEIIGAPFDLCGHTAGSRLGPSALRFANLISTLQATGCEVKDSGDIDAEVESTPANGVRNFKPFLATTKLLHAAVLESCKAGNVPIMLGGDHSLSMASVSGALAHHGDRLAVLWVDAHADLNTPDTSPSGNLHGMSMGALIGAKALPGGKSESQWNELLARLGPTRLSPSKSAWFGLRDVDQGERERLRNIRGRLAITMHDIDRNGVVTEVERFHEWMAKSGATALWISFDVDALDPFLAPGTGTAVRGGLSYREAHLFAELIHELTASPGCPYKIAGVDIVEVNPLCDSNNATAKVAVEWIASLFGKTILGPH